MQKSHWCFTWNNPEGYIDWPKEDPDNKVRYAIYSEEVGENGTIHFQGYVEFHRSVRLNTLREYMDGEAHWEPRRGTREQARDYCRKLTDPTFLSGPYEYGDYGTGGLGTRNDITSLKQSVDEGKSLKEIWDLYPSQFLRYHRAIQQAKTLSTPPRSTVTELYLLIGATGTGKSSYVREHHPTAYWKQRSIWWDGYENQEVICLDDYYGWLPFDELLRLADGNPLIVQTKGGQATFNSSKIYITTNLEPFDWYKSERVTPHFPALYRRITKVFQFTGFKEFKIWNSYKEYSDSVLNTYILQ